MTLNWRFYCCQMCGFSFKSIYLISLSVCLCAFPFAKIYSSLCCWEKEADFVSIFARSEGMPNPCLTLLGYLLPPHHRHSTTFPFQFWQITFSFLFLVYPSIQPRSKWNSFIFPFLLFPMACPFCPFYGTAQWESDNRQEEGVKVRTHFEEKKKNGKWVRKGFYKT